MEELSKYQQLQPEERERLARLMAQGVGVREASRLMGRSASSISRELRRNQDENEAYVGCHAQRMHVDRRRKARPDRKLALDGVRWGLLLTLLDWKWSPQQIAGRLRHLFPERPDWQMSHETIYNAIYAQPRGELRKQLIACLRQGHSTRLPRSRGQDRRGRIADMLSIHVRPPEIEDRLLPGHWEGDFIKGAGNQSSVGVLVERQSRLVLLAKMDDATAASALAGFAAKLNAIAAPMRRSLTYDQGKEMAQHAQLTQQTGVKVYFCDPHSPWQRGTCENTNGLLRQYLPKGTDLSRYSQIELDTIADSLNSRPRATHGFNSPLAVFAHALANTTTTVHNPPAAIQ